VILADSPYGSKVAYSDSSVADGTTKDLRRSRLTSRPKLEAYGVYLDRTEPVLGAARAAPADGILGYALLVADKPA
jgi:hypothetical protein